MNETLATKAGLNGPTNKRLILAVDAAAAPDAIRNYAKVK